MIRLPLFLILILTAMTARNAMAQVGLDQLPTLLPGRTAAQNALWLENELTARFNGVTVSVGTGTGAPVPEALIVSPPLVLSEFTVIVPP